MRPIRTGIKRVIALVARTPQTPRPVPLLKEQEFLYLLEEGHREGAIRASELELIRNVFELDDTAVSEIYTPIAQVATIPAGITGREALQRFKGKRYSRVPVVDATAHKVIGILFTKDLLFQKMNPIELNHPIDAIVHRPLIVAPSTRLNVVFRRMREMRAHMAVVETKPGHAVGVVTMHDVLDAIFEELFVEEDGPPGSPTPLGGRL
jgi:putative hemolysin